MIRQTVTFQALTSLSSSYISFNNKLDDTESSKHACKSHTVSAERTLYHCKVIPDLVTVNNGVAI